MEVQVSGTKGDIRIKEGCSSVNFDELKEAIDQAALDFNGWISLISEVDKSYHDDIEKIRLAYDGFLSEFPLCHGYWRKYAFHVARLCPVREAIKIFERTVQSATYSVGAWLDYCRFAISVFKDSNDVRRLFKRAMSFVGKDYLCHTLWDKYIEFEFSQQQWSSLAHVYIQTLRFPSKKLHRYYENFIKLSSIWKEENGCLDVSSMDTQSDSGEQSKVSKCYTDEDVSHVIKALLDCSNYQAGTEALRKYLSIGKQLYNNSCKLDMKISGFEMKIQRSYFHVKPLDVSQLENWHEYLNFAESQDDFDWAVKIFERCLIPCAHYAEFWMRYVDFAESKGGREVAKFALARATQIYLKRIPVIHVFHARYNEQIGDINNARSAFLPFDISDSHFVENVITEANMERRLGNFAAASNIYKEALEIAATKDGLQSLPALYIQFSRHEYMITNNVDAARDILVDGNKMVPNCKLLLEELINFEILHGSSSQIHVIDSIVDSAISGGRSLNAEDAECISKLYLQFADLCGTINDVRKAWLRHLKLFPNSMRTTHGLSNAGIKPLRVTLCRRQETVDIVPLQPSEDHSSDSQTNLPCHEKKPGTDAINSYNSTDEQASPGHILPFLGCHEIVSDQSRANLCQPDQQEESSSQMEQHPCKTSGLPEEDSMNPNPSCIELTHEACNDIEASQASQEISRDSGLHKEHDSEPEKEVDSLSLERVTLCLDHKSVVVHYNESLQQSSLSTGIMKGENCEETSISKGSLPEDEEIEKDRFVHSRLDNCESAICVSHNVTGSSSETHRTVVTEADLRHETRTRSGRNWHEGRNFDRVRREAEFGFHGHHQKKFNEKRQTSRQHHSRNETGNLMAMSEAYPGQQMSSTSPDIQQGDQALGQYSRVVANTNLEATQNFGTQHGQQQSFASTQLQLSPILSQAQCSQSPGQGNAQVQNNQEYNQMWQYYYYQQQQLLWQQMQFHNLQQQQNQQQEPQQQQYQHQLQMQQQYFLQQQQEQQQTLQQPFQQEQLPQQNYNLYLQQQQQLQLQQVQYQQWQQQLLQQNEQGQEMDLGEKVNGVPDELDSSLGVASPKSQQKS